MGRDPGHDAQPPPRGDFLHQIESLLAAAGSFQRSGAELELNAISCAESELTASTDHSDRNSSGEEDNHYRPGRPLAGARPLKKRQRRLAPQPSSAVPTSITTTSMSWDEPKDAPSFPIAVNINICVCAGITR